MREAVNLEKQEPTNNARVRRTVSKMEMITLVQKGRQSVTMKAGQMEVIKFAKERLEELLATTSWEEAGEMNMSSMTAKHPGWRLVKP